MRGIARGFQRNGIRLVAGEQFFHGGKHMLAISVKNIHGLITRIHIKDSGVFL